MASKEERLIEFFRRLTAAPPQTDGEAALALISRTLMTVEDELSGLPNNPSAWLDGRLYPPQADAARAVAARPDVTRYRSRGHNTYIRANGAIRIEPVGSRTAIFEKVGHDRQHVFSNDDERK